jgi:hypothetical protein
MLLFFVLIVKKRRAVFQLLLHVCKNKSNTVDLVRVNPEFILRLRVKHRVCWQVSLLKYFHKCNHTLWMIT